MSPNRFEIGPPRCGIARTLQVYTLRTSFEPCHCQFRTDNGDSWSIKLNIETYPLLLLSPSSLPIFSYPSPRLEHYYKNIGSSSHENASPTVLSRRTEPRNGEVSARFLLKMNGDMWNRITRGQTLRRNRFLV